MTGNLSDGLLIFYRFYCHLGFEAVNVLFSVRHRLKTPLVVLAFLTYIVAQMMNDLPVRNTPYSTAQVLGVITVTFSAS